MPALVDTTIRLLGQEPLAGRMPTAAVLRLAEILDGAGFDLLEISGGGDFDSAVRRGVESPWERIRALKARTKTPLGMALRGRFLVGSHPVDGDFVRRFVACAAENGIDVFRLHDPLNDVSNLRDAAEAIEAAGREFDAGLVYSSGKTGETDSLVEQARKLSELGAARVVLHDPTGSLQPHRVQELVGRVGEASGLPVGVYCQGAAGNALAAALEAARAGAELIACAVYPVALTLHRVSGEALAQALAGLGLECSVDVQALWRAADLIDEHIGDEPVTPLAPRIAVRAAEHSLPAGLVAAIDMHLRAHAAGDRIDDVLDELERIRAEAGAPPLAAPISQILASQALLHVLSARRYQTVVDERTIEEDDLRVTVRRTDDRRELPLPSGGTGSLEVEEPELEPVAPRSDGLVRVEAPMVGTFYRSPQPGAPPFVQEGEPVGAGQTLCILEAMKLMNEVKSDLDAIVRAVDVENAQPVEFGQLLFELEPLNGRPLDAL